MSESSRLAGAAVNGDADVDDVGDVAEELVQVGVGHLKGQVADEEGLGGGVLGLDGVAGLGHVVDDEAAAFEDGLVALLDGVAGGLDVFEFNVAESVWRVSLCSFLIPWRVEKGGGEDVPLAKTSGVLSDSTRDNISIRRELPLQILRRSLKQQITDINRVGRLQIHRRPGVRARSILPILHSEAALGRSSDGGADALLLRRIGGDGLVGRRGAVEALEGRDHGGLLADGEGGGGAGGGAEEGARWGGERAGCCSLDEMPVWSVVSRVLMCVHWMISQGSCGIEVVRGKTYMMMGLENALVCGFGKMMFLFRGGMRMDEVENNGLVRGRITFRRTGLALATLRNCLS